MGEIRLFGVRWVCECSITIAATPPSEVIIETVVDGAVGPGPFTFSIAGQSIVLNGEDTATVDVAIGRNDLAAAAPPTWNEVDKSCDRDRDLEATDDGFAITTDDNGETVTCTFTLRAVNQDLGRSGDPNCDGVIDVVDALVIAQYDAFVRGGAAACSSVDAATELSEPAADFDGSGGIDILDALQVARCTVGLPAPPCAEAFALD